MSNLMLDALKIGAQAGREIPLYRRGKVAGLFAQRTRATSEAANHAIADGLIEIARVETAGKTSVEWARVTPKGLAYLLDCESPATALRELRDALALNHDGLPAWAADVRSRLDQIAAQVDAEVQAMRSRLDQMARQVDAALARLEAKKHEPTAASVPWANEVLEYIERRIQVGLGSRCPLADLFTSLREKHADLSIKSFHAGLRQMQHAKLIALAPSTGLGDIPGPEYALLDGASVYYYVGRADQAA